MPKQRLTLIVRDPHQPFLDWKHRERRQAPISFTESVEVLRFMLRSGMRAIELDIERVVIDRAASDREYLELLAQLPAEFMGDVLLVRPDSTGIISALGRGSGRVLYSLGPADIRFYLETHDLVTGRLAIDTQLTQRIA